MKQFRRRTRICILSLLFLSVCAPILLLYESKGFIEDLSSFKGRRELLKLNIVKQEEGGGLREPILNVYKDVNVDPLVGFGSPDTVVKSDDLGNGGNNDFSGNEGDLDAKGNSGQRHEEQMLSTSGRKGEVGRATLGHDQDVPSHVRMATDKKIKEMKDQLIRAKAYLSFAIPAGNTHLIKELRLRIKELERAMGEVSRDSDLSKRALQRMRAMEVSLQKAARIYPDGCSMVKKLRAMTNNAEELVRVQKEQESFLVQLAGRTTPKGLHCLSMRLTAEYFALKPEERQLPSNPDVHDSNRYHFVVFSDNVLACSVVVDSTISTAKDPGKIVFHVVTDSLNFAAISMWFILHSPKKASVQIHNMENFGWFHTKYDPPNAEGHDSQDPRYTSALNHLRFYLPDIFPILNKIVLLDHDVVVQKDLTRLWRVNLAGKVNGAVKTCQGNDPAFRRMHLLLNFSDPTVANRFSNEECTWAFGVNVFDIGEWRRRNLTNVYKNYLQLGKKKTMWKAGSLPLGWMTFYNQTTVLDPKWHVHGLGYHSGIKQEDIEHAAVIHYDGVMKPWLDIGIEKYKTYWRKHVKYNHPYLQQCNIA